MSPSLLSGLIGLSNREMGGSNPPRLPLVESAIIGGFLHFWGCNRVIWNTSVALFACDAGFTNCRGTPGFPKKTSAGRWEGPLSRHIRRSLFVCPLKAARTNPVAFNVTIAKLYAYVTQGLPP